jgi:hypothetical protein
MVRMMAKLSGIQIVSIVGLQGAGKSSIGDQLHVDLEDSTKIEVSDVVRAVHGDRPRSQMASTREFTLADPSWLGEAVARKITDTTDTTVVILSGVREPEVHNTLREFDCALSVVKVLADPTLRFNRVKALGKCDTWEEFTEQERREMALGLNKILLTSDFMVESTEETTVPQLASQVIEYLRGTE